MIECGNTVPQSGFFLLAVGFQSQISPYNDTQICSDFMRTWHGIRDWCESRSFGPIGPMLRWNQHEDPESGLGKYSNVHSFSLLTTVVEAIFSTPTTKLQKVPHPSTIEQRSRTTSCRRPRGPWCLQNSSPYLAQMGGLDVPTEQYWPSKIATQQKKCINPTPKISKNGCATSGNKLCSESVRICVIPSILIQRSNGPMQPGRGTHARVEHDDIYLLQFFNLRGSFGLGNHASKCQQGPIIQVWPPKPKPDLWLVA